MGMGRILDPAPNSFWDLETRRLPAAYLLRAVSLGICFSARDVFGCKPQALARRRIPPAAGGFPRHDVGVGWSVVRYLCWARSCVMAGILRNFACGPEKPGLHSFRLISSKAWKGCPRPLRGALTC